MTRKTFTFLFFLAVLASLPLVYAPDEDINFDEFDDQLAERLQIPLFAAQLLSASLFLGWFIFPGLLMSKDYVAQSFVVLIIGLPIMGFCIAMGWLPTWLLLITCLIVALMYAAKIRGFLGG